MARKRSVAGPDSVQTEAYCRPAGVREPATFVALPRIALFPWLSTAPPEADTPFTVLWMKLERVIRATANPLETSPVPFASATTLSRNRDVCSGGALI